MRSSEKDMIMFVYVCGCGVLNWAFGVAWTVERIRATLCTEKILGTCSFL
jgi:hypothetical protein